MQHITLHKRPGESYKAHSFKCYDAHHNGEYVGYIAQDLGNKWEVVDRDFKPVSRHTTIKAAVRVAGKALL